MQVYRGLDIGTSKLSPGERATIPHHLIDIRDPGDVFTAGDFALLAAQAIRQIHARGKLPIVTGGTGFYLRALLDGLFEGPGRDEALRARLHARQGPVVWRFLRYLDPECARRIHPNDQNKVVRAIEVCLQTGQRMSDAHAGGRKGLPGVRVLRLLLNPPRALLYDRVNRKCAEMFQSGLEEETRRHLDAGLAPGSQPMLAVGYRQMVQYIQGELTLQQALEKAQQATRNYAKRQLTWFRREPDVVVLDGFGDQPEIVAEACARISGALAAGVPLAVPHPPKA
jgi:tRNA dimethylallyltransferase